jgi:uncharacterized membrane protein required for colicin V production
MPVNALDIIIALPILIFFVAGLKNGFIEEIVGLIGQVIAIFLAFTYMSDVSVFWEEFYDIESAWIPFFSFVAIYLVSMIVVKLIIKLMESIIKLAKMSVLNHFFGGVFSGLKGALIVSTFLVILGVLGQPSSDYTKDSLLYSYVLPIAPTTYNYISRVLPGVGEFQDQAGEYFKDLDVSAILAGQENQDTETPSGQ